MAQWTLDVLVRKLYAGNIPYACWLQKVSLIMNILSSQHLFGKFIGSLCCHPPPGLQHGLGQDLGPGLNRGFVWARLPRICHVSLSICTC